MDLFGIIVSKNSIIIVLLLFFPTLVDKSAIFYHFIVAYKSQRNYFLIFLLIFTKEISGYYIF